MTVEGDTHPLPEPFFVLATQNPVEQEGTFELPEAQVDRFMIKTTLGYPDRDGEVEILDRRLGRTTQTPALDALLSPDEVRALQAAVRPSASITTSSNTSRISPVRPATTTASKLVSPLVGPSGFSKSAEHAPSLRDATS